MLILVATDREIVVIDVARGAATPAHGIGNRPTCLTADPLVHGRAWCGTHRGGMFRSDDGGGSWQSVGLAGRLIMAVTASPVEPGVVWVGTEPSEVWRSGDAGSTWEQTSRLETLSSSSEWSFPPRPDTHHVRWIACHPLEPERLWVAIEAGALVSTIDGGRTWRDRVPGGPWDTHELAVHWERVRDGWPEPASTIAPLLCAGTKTGEFWAADERGVHHSGDGGKSWRQAVGYATSPQHLRGLALCS
jgi:photosystem II stability/assembly factor-like uncharacterized protein